MNRLHRPNPSCPLLLSKFASCLCFFRSDILICRFLLSCRQIFSPEDFEKIRLAQLKKEAEAQLGKGKRHKEDGLRMLKTVPDTVVDLDDIGIFLFDLESFSAQ